MVYKNHDTTHQYIANQNSNPRRSKLIQYVRAIYHPCAQDCAQPDEIRKTSPGEASLALLTFLLFRLQAVSAIAGDELDYSDRGG